MRGGVKMFVQRLLLV